MTTTVTIKNHPNFLDSYIFAGEPDWNYGGMPTLVAGGWTAPNFYGNKSLISIPSLSTDYPNTQIVSAKIRIRTFSEESSTDYNVSIHRSLVLFYTGIKSGAVPDPNQNASTWNHRNYFGSVAWAGGPGGAAGSDYEATPTDTKLITGPEVWYEWDVTSDVQGFVDGTFSNYGWWLVGTGGSVASAKIFYSTQTSSYPCELVLVYNLNTSQLLEPTPSDVISSTVTPTIVSGTTLDAIQPILAVSETVNPQTIEGSISLTPTAVGSVARTVSGTYIKSSAVQTGVISYAVTGTVLEDLIIDLEISPTTSAVAYGNVTGILTASRPTPISNCVDPLLYITDGTVKENGQLNRLDLLNTRSGFLLNNWRPSIAQYKDGGYFADSRTSSGRKLVRKVFENPIEIFELKARGISQNDLIEYIRDLMFWQEAASDYWTSSWKSNPVYLVAKAANETNPRYAIVHMISVPDLDNPYGQPFFKSGKVGAEEIVLRLERGDWMSLPPGQGECVPVSNQKSWSFGNWYILSSDPTGNVTTISESPDGSLVAGTDDTAKIYKSFDGGSIWSLLSTLGSDPADCVQKIIKGHDNYLVAAVSGSEAGSGIWRSTNNGQTWTKWFTPPTLSGGASTSGSLTLQPDATNGIDTWIDQSEPTRNQGTTSMLIAGRAGSDNRKTILRFDLSSIPPNATITNAKLRLYCYFEYSTNNYNVSAHRALTQWFEGLQMGGQSPQPGENGSTWNLRNHNGSVPWAGGAGGGSGSDYSASATDTETITGTGSWFEWDISSDVQGFVDGSYQNYGWWLIGEAVNNSGKSFYSSDYSGASLRPTLTVSYAISYPSSVGYYGVEYSPGLQEYFATGGAVGGAGVISRTMFWNGSANFDQWYHTQHNNGDILRSVLLPAVPRLNIPETFLAGSSNSSSFGLLKNPNVIHAPPSVQSDFTNVLPNMVSGVTAMVSNFSTVTGYCLLGTSSGRLYRLEPGNSGGNPWQSPALIHTFPGPVTSLFIRRIDPNPASDLGLIVYAGSNSSIYRSDNGGYTWTLLTTFPTGEVESFYQTDDLLMAGENSQIDGYRLYSEFEFGQEPICGTGSFVVNRSHRANLTHVKRYDHSITTFQNLQFEEQPPYRLLPIIPEANDAAYFGISDGDESNPFSSVVFDIITPSSSITSITWQYWNGSSWGNLTVQDNTQQFALKGISSVHWNPPSNWALTTIDGISAWWVRAKVDSVGSSPVGPVVGNRYLYTVSDPKVEILGNEVGGDIPALAKIRWRNQSGCTGSGTSLQAQRVICGLRSLDRGRNFNSFLNISDVQAPFGLVISKSTDGTWTSASKAPTGRYLSVTYPSSAGLNVWNTLATIELLNTVAKDYYGQYRAFVRVYKPAGTATTWQLRLQTILGSGGAKSNSRSEYVRTTGDWEVIDLGPISIPSGLNSQIGSDLGNKLSINIQGFCTTQSIDLNLYDLILIPVDEWAADCTTPDTSEDCISAISTSHYLEIDSLSNPRISTSGLNRDASDQIVSIYQTVHNGPAILQVGRDQNLWFFTMTYSSGWKAKPDISGSIEVYTSQRYLSHRGRS